MRQCIKDTITIIAFMLPVMTLNAQGIIKGKVTDARTNESLPGANVIIDGTLTVAVTDFDGKFVLKNIKAGTYNLKVSFVGYQPQLVKEVGVIDGRESNIEIDLNSNMNQLGTTEVVAARVTHTEAAVLMEIKQAEQIVTGVSSQQIAKSQDRTATDVVKRIPGVTIVENRFIMVRGLSERYNSVLLNGILTPSAEVDRKAFSFDIIPSALLDRVMIYKTGAPELPGEFAGGVIKVFTKNVPDENSISIGYSASYRSGTTFNDFYTGAKGKTDWMGFDDGTRALPANFPKNLNQVTDLNQVIQHSKTLPNNWFTKMSSALPDQRFNLLFTHNFKPGRIKIGNITNINYSNLRESFFSDHYNYNTYDIEAKQSDSIYKYYDYVCNEVVRVGLIHNWSFILSDHHKIEFRNLFNQMGTNQTTLRGGYNIEEDGNVKNYSFYYQQRSVYSGQLGGQHDFNENRTKVDWTGGYALTKTKEPDFRRVRSKTESLNSFDKYYVIIAPSASTLDAGRFYSDLEEDIITGAANAEHAFKSRKEGKEEMVKIRTGIYYEHKTRTFDARWMSYKRALTSQFDNSLLELPVDTIFSEENINTPHGFKLEEGTNPSDSYDASNDLMAFYVGTSYPVTKKINISGGVRLENNRQQLYSRKYNNELVSVDNDVLSLLPSANVSYNLTDRTLIRGAYSRTLNRPEFRELAPFSYYDFTYNYVIYGNDSLLTPIINNYDLRWEFYPSNAEIISIGGFYKTFELPIERFFVPGTGSGGTRNFTFGNADNSASIGVETEVKKSLQEIFKSGVLSKLSIYFNASVIHSKVALGEKARGQSPNRPMMGQSPFIVNAGLYYNKKESQLQVNLLYNVIGRRLYAVGTVGTPDIYEMPRNLIDLTLIKGFGKHIEIKIGVQDLLNQEILLKQDADENGKISINDELILSRKPGSYYTVGVNFKF